MRRKLQRRWLVTLDAVTPGRVSAFVLVCGIVWAAWPACYEVAGLSMGPGLLPGDRVCSGLFPWFDRYAVPHRFEKWIVTAPDGTTAIKRVVGLPREGISIHNGDLAVDGTPLVTPPRVLSQLASLVPEAVFQNEDGIWQRLFSHPVIFDDAQFATHESRRLLPVNDVGMAAVICLPVHSPAISRIEMFLRVGSRAVKWPLDRGGRHAFIAGRLDAHLVGASWPLPYKTGNDSLLRSGLPAGVPPAWSVVTAWPITEPIDSGDGASAIASVMPLALLITRAGVAIDSKECDRWIESLVVWRDILHRPPATLNLQWQLGAGEVFVLGDFPSASWDSRAWGPLDLQYLRHRIVSP
ncbi:MAG: S26 family signal peptidase [Planctomycetota bacterium]